MRLLASGALLVLAFGVGGCSTPDMTAFATQTAALQTAVAAEHQEIGTQYDAIIRLTEQGAREGWFSSSSPTLVTQYEPTTWQKERADVAAIAIRVDQFMGDLTAYSASLVELAAKGETGRDAAQQALASFTKITDLIAGPGITIPQTATAVLSEIAGLYTRGQAQNSLDDAMSAITTRHGAQQVVTVLKTYFNREDQLVVGLRTSRIQLERYRVGPAVISFYLNQNSWAAREHAFDLLNLDNAANAEAIRSIPEAQLYVDLLKCSAPGGQGCRSDSGLAARLASTQTLLAAVTGDAQSFFQAQDQIESWTKTRNDKVSAIDVALDSWATEHDRLASYLHDCGGFRAFKVACGNYTAANLQAAVQKIEDVVSDLRTAPTPAPAASVNN